MKPLPSVSARLIEMAPADSKWNWLDDLQSRAAVTARPVPVGRESYVRLEIELKPLILETKAFQLPFNPPRYSRNKKGELKEDKMTIRYLDVTAGNLRFRVMRNTDPGKVSLRAREVARRCGDQAADQFRKAAAEIVPPLEREKSRPAPDWNTPATGVCNRFRKA